MRPSLFHHVKIASTIVPSMLNMSCQVNQQSVILHVDAVLQFCNLLIPMSGTGMYLLYVRLIIKSLRAP